MKTEKELVEITHYIIENINSKSDEKKSKWLENYVKHNIKSKGVGIPEIRKIVIEANNKFDIDKRIISDQINIIDALISQKYTEDKLAAIIFVQLFWKDIDSKIVLNVISNWFDKGFIFDWNVCDWLCVRLLTPLLEIDTEFSIKEFKSWNKDKNLWKARASLVPFAQLKSISNHLEIIEILAKNLINREERFCKTAVGWVLREISKHNVDFVKIFLDKNRDLITNEVLKNATKYID